MAIELGVMPWLLNNRPEKHIISIAASETLGQVVFRVGRSNKRHEWWQWISMQISIHNQVAWATACEGKTKGSGSAWGTSGQAVSDCVPSSTGKGATSVPRGHTCAKQPV